MKRKSVFILLLLVIPALALIKFWSVKIGLMSPSPAPIYALPTFPTIINSKGDRFIKQTEKYNIEFLPLYNQYLISVRRSPFSETRLEAERVFLQEVGISQEQACKLNVVISTPSFANPGEAGRFYGLSFCETAPQPTASTPSSSLNP